MVGVSGAEKEGVAVFASVNVTGVPESCVQLKDVIGPVELEPFRITVEPNTTVSSSPALAATGIGPSDAPVTVTSMVLCPPAVEWTVTRSGANVRFVVLTPFAGTLITPTPKSSTVKIGAPMESLEVAMIVRT